MRLTEANNLYAIKQIIQFSGRQIFKFVCTAEALQYLGNVAPAAYFYKNLSPISKRLYYSNHNQKSLCLV